jgi:hypothetical protein
MNVTFGIKELIQYFFWGGGGRGDEIYEIYFVNCLHSSIYIHRSPTTVCSFLHFKQDTRGWVLEE